MFIVVIVAAMAAEVVKVGYPMQGEIYHCVELCKYSPLTCFVNIFLVSAW